MSEATQMVLRSGLGLRWKPGTPEASKQASPASQGASDVPAVVPAQGWEGFLTPVCHSRSGVRG